MHDLGRGDGRRAGWPRRLAVLGLTLGLLVAGVTPVAAATQSRSTAISMTGGLATDANWDIEGRCDGCVPDDFAAVAYDDDALYEAVVQARVHLTELGWSSNASIDTSFDDQLLRQGRTLDLKDVMTVTGGTMTAKGTISGSMFIERDGTTNVQDFGSFSAPMNLSWACAVPLPGESPRPCSSGNADTTVLSIKILDVTLGKVFLTLKVGASLTANVSTNGVVSSAEISIPDAGSSESKNLTWVGSSPSTVTDARALACTAPVGSEVFYRFAGGSTSGAVQNLASTIKLIGAVLISPAVGPDHDVVEYAFKELPQAPLPFDMGLSGGNSGTISLGTLAKNNLPPTPDAGGGAGHTYSGNQGSPITFDGSGSTSACGFPTLRWDFSDGGVAFGKNPQHTFQGSGTYSGLLTATDVTGLSSSTTFSVAVANLAPVVWPGPPMTAAWGRNVTFNASATDPGADDQSTLLYSWNFGDGATSNNAGPSVQHAYATPGVYLYTLNVCDRHLLCATESQVITIRKRSVSMGALGDTVATFDTAGFRRASLVDEFGQGVNGRTVEFTVDGAGAGSGVTNGAGFAQAGWLPALAAGTYSTGASFAGDSLYTAADGAGSVAIARKGTSVAYTGATSGAPNKVVTLTAVLKDATGTALAGRTIVFVVGSQTISATTDASGVATANLKLTQKNGTYPLSATWSPAGTDAARYVGSAASATFKLQAK